MNTAINILIRKVRNEFNYFKMSVLCFFLSCELIRIKDIKAPKSSGALYIHIILLLYIQDYHPK